MNTNKSKKGIRVSHVLCYATLCVGAALTSLEACAAEFRLSADYSVTNNPNRVWSYGWKETLGGPFTLLNYRSVGNADNGQPVHALAYAANTHPAVFFNPGPNVAVSDGGQGQFPPGSVWYTGGHDGTAQNYGVIRFTAPSNGVYRIGVGAQAYLDGPSSGDADFYVVRNSKEVNGWFLPSRGGTHYTNTLILAPGETLDFAVGRGADNHLASSGVKIDSIITLISNLPPPTITNEPPQRHRFDVARDFSANSNPNGVWSYGWKSNLAGSFTHVLDTRTAWADNGVPYQVIEYQTYGTPPYFLFFPFTNTLIGTSDNGQGQYAPGTLMFFPGFNTPLNFGVIRFTAPSNGNYKIGVAVRAYLDGPRSGDASFHVVRNGDTIYNQPLGPLAGTVYTNTLSLLAGQTIDFAVGRGADDSLNGSGLKIAALITPTTEAPGTNQPPVLHPDFNASRDFSTNTNPNGVWSYGWKTNLSGNLSLLDGFHRSAHPNGVPYDVREFGPGAPPMVMHHPWSNTTNGISDSGVFPPGTMALQAGFAAPQNLVVVRFTAPSNGSYRVHAAVAPGFEGPPQGDTDFHVIRNGTELFGVFLAPTNRAAYTNIVALLAGDTIDFAVGRGADNNANGSLEKLVAIVVPTTDSSNVTNPPTHADFVLSRDFSVSSNPNGVWSYGYAGSLGGAFTLMSTARMNEVPSIPLWSWSVNGFSSPDIHFNASSTNVHYSDGGVFPPHTVWVSPGDQTSPNALAVIRFTAPSNGSYLVRTAARSYIDAFSGDTDFHVTTNNTEVFGVFLPAGAQSTGYTNTFVLRAGDTVDLVIGRGADNSLAGSALKLDAVITPGAAVTNPPVIIRTDFNASRDFKTNSNPNGVWSYGWKTNLSGNLSLLDGFHRSAHPNGVPYDVREFGPGAPPMVMHHPWSNTTNGISDSGVFPPGTMALQAGFAAPQNLVVVRFTAPSNGSYRVHAAVAPGFGGPPQGDTDFHVIRNGTELFGVFLAPTNRAAYTNIVALLAGDTIDFAVGRGADNNANGSLEKLGAIVTPTSDAPPTVILASPDAGTVGGLKRLGGGAFEITVDGIGGTYAIEASSDLSEWVLLQTVVNASGTIQFIDPDAAELPNRFYRARLIQD